MKHQKTIQVIGGAIIISAASFYLGLQRGKSVVPFPQGGRIGAGQFGSMTGGVRRGGAAGGLVAGEIISKDDTSVIVKSRDGSSKIVLFSSATQIMKSAQGSIVDIEAGKQVTVVGTANADGSITAQSIQLGTIMPIRTPVAPPPSNSN
jgi:hypothetical protein